VNFSSQSQYDKRLANGEELIGSSVLNLIGFFLNLRKEIRLCNTVLNSNIRKYYYEIPLPYPPQSQEDSSFKMERSEVSWLGNAERRGLLCCVSLFDPGEQMFGRWDVRWSLCSVGSL